MIDWWYTSMIHILVLLCKNLSKFSIPILRGKYKCLIRSYTTWKKLKLCFENLILYIFWICKLTKVFEINSKLLEVLYKIREYTKKIRSFTVWQFESLAVSEFRSFRASEFQSFLWDVEELTFLIKIYELILFMNCIFILHIIITSLLLILLYGTPWSK